MKKTILVLLSTITLSIYANDLNFYSNYGCVNKSLLDEIDNLVIQEKDEAKYKLQEYVDLGECKYFNIEYIESFNYISTESYYYLIEESNNFIIKK